MFYKIILQRTLVVILAFSIAVVVVGQEEAPDQEDEAPKLKNRTVYFDPVSVFVGNLKVGYEQRFDRGKQALFVLPHLQYYSLGRSQVRRGGGVEVDYRFYLGDESEEDESWSEQLQGYVAPFARFKYREVGNERTQYTGNQQITVSNTRYYSIFSGGMTFGLKAPLAQFFTIDLFFGGGFRYSKAGGNYSHNGFLGPGYTGVIPKMGLRVGVDF
jgi:hypothetical protein